MNAWRISAPWSIGAIIPSKMRPLCRRRSGRYAAMMIFDGFSFRSVAAAADAG
jgi:hypothetical protein